MTHSAYIVRIDTTSSDGSRPFSRSLYVDRPDTGAGAKTGVDAAARMLADWETGESYMRNRTVTVHECQVEHDPKNVETGVKAFDDKAARSEGLTAGSSTVSSNTQISRLVAGFGEVDRNGLRYPPGQLRQSDLGIFQIPMVNSGSRLDELLDRLRDPALMNESLVLYQVFHTLRTGDRRVHGWVVTKPEGEHVLTHQVTGGAASKSILDRATAAFTFQTVPGSERLVLDIRSGVLMEVDQLVRERADELHEGMAAQVDRPRG